MSTLLSLLLKRSLARCSGVPRAKNVQYTHHTQKVFRNTSSLSRKYRPCLGTSKTGIIYSLLDSIEDEMKLMVTDYLGYKKICKSGKNYQLSSSKQIKFPTISRKLFIPSTKNIYFSTVKVRYIPPPISICLRHQSHSPTASFDEVCSETLNVLSESLEELPDFIPDLSELFDVEYNGEVLTLHIKEGCTYVINRQAPNQQIWLSSPISGPKRYDFVDGDWIYSHDNTKMIELLESELGELFDFEFELNDVRHCLLPFS